MKARTCSIFPKCSGITESPLKYLSIFENLDPPLICYQYKSPIRNIIFNYNQVTFNPDVLSSIQPSWSCVDSPFLYPPAGHVDIGDLTCIPDKGLRSLFQKGPKYRLSSRIDFTKGPITIRRTPLPTFLVNFSTFAFLWNFSFMKLRKHQSFRDRGCICITNVNNRDFYVHQGIYLKEYIGISTFSYTILFPPVLHNFLQKISVDCCNKLCTRRKLCNTGGNDASRTKNRMS